MPLLAALLFAAAPTGDSEYRILFPEGLPRDERQEAAAETRSIPEDRLQPLLDRGLKIALAQYDHVRLALRSDTAEVYARIGRQLFLERGGISFHAIAPEHVTGPEYGCICEADPEIRVGATPEFDGRQIVQVDMDPHTCSLTIWLSADIRPRIEELLREASGGPLHSHRLTLALVDGGSTLRSGRFQVDLTRESPALTTTTHSVEDLCVLKFLLGSPPLPYPLEWVPDQG